MHRISRTAYLRTVLCAAATVAAAGCGDAPTEPAALLIAPETEAALEVDRGLPTLPRLIDAARSDLAARDHPPADRGALRRAELLWRQAGTAPGEDAEALREEARRLAARPLAEMLDADALERRRADVAYWTDAASDVLADDDGSELARAVAAARRELEHSRHADEPVAAVRALLRAADHLTDITPRAVALRLIATAEAARSHAPDTPEGERAAARDRAQRLLDGAYEAFAQGDHARAIRRAYYATQLLREH